MSGMPWILFCANVTAGAEVDNAKAMRELHFDIVYRGGNHEVEQSIFSELVLTWLRFSSNELCQYTRLRRDIRVLSSGCGISRWIL